MTVYFVSFTVLLTAIYLYRQRRGHLWLRLPALVLLLLAGINFVLRLPGRGSARPVLILIDASQSMRRYLPEVLLKLDKSGLSGSRYYIGDRGLLSALPAPESLSRWTDLTLALETGRRLDPSAIVLISDGRHNHGPDPRLRLNQDWSIPIFTVAVGADTVHDAALVSAVGPAYVFPGDTFTLEATVETKGLTAIDSGSLILSLNNKYLGRSAIKAGQELSRSRHRFRLSAAEPGSHEYRFSLSSWPGEINYNNNEYFLSVEVLKKATKVLYYCGHPSFNQRFFKSVLANAERMELHHLLQAGPQRMLLNGQPVDSTLRFRAADYDVLILDQVSGQNFPITDLIPAVRQGLGVLYIGTGEDLPPELSAILPIQTSGSLPAGTYSLQIQRIFSVLTPAEKYPPLNAIGRVLKVEPSATVVASHDKHAVIAYRALGRGIVFQINASDLMPWFFQPAGSGQERLGADFCLDLVRFLSVLGPKQRLVLRPDRTEMKIGESVTMHLSSYSTAFEPCGGGDFFLIARNESIPFFEIKPGQYEMTYQPADTGLITCFAAGSLEGDTLVSEKLTLKIRSAPAESEEGIDWIMLKELASRTDGQTVDLTGMKEIKLSVSSRRTSMRIFSLDTPLVYFLIFALLAADWWLRRRRGLV